MHDAQMSSSLVQFVHSRSLFLFSLAFLGSIRLICLIVGENFSLMPWIQTEQVFVFVSFYVSFPPFAARLGACKMLNQSWRYPGVDVLGVSF